MSKKHGKVYFSIHKNHQNKSIVNKTGDINKVRRQQKKGEKKNIFFVYFSLK